MQRFISFPAPQPVPLRLNTAAVGIGYLQNNYTVLLNQVEIYPPLFLRDLFARLNGIVQQISQNRTPVHILHSIPSHLKHSSAFTCRLMPAASALLTLSFIIIFTIRLAVYLFCSSSLIGF